MELLPTIDALPLDRRARARRSSPTRRSRPPIFLKQKRSWFAYEPLGVVGVIAPWNYPWSIPFGEVAIALMCGNGVVLKPASLTPLIGERIQEVFERAGVPEGLVRTVHGGGAVGNALVESSAAKIFFTGSVEVGRQRRRGLRRAAQGLRARARRQGPGDRARGRRPAERGGRLPLGRLRQRRADLRAGSSASTWCARWPTGSSTASSTGAKALRVGRPDRAGHRGRPDGLARAVRARQASWWTTRSPRARRCTAAGRSTSPASRTRPSSRRRS